MNDKTHFLIPGQFVGSNRRFELIARGSEPHLRYFRLLRNKGKLDHYQKLFSSGSPFAILPLFPEQAGEQEHSED